MLFDYRYGFVTETLEFFVLRVKTWNSSVGIEIILICDYISHNASAVTQPADVQGHHDSLHSCMLANRSCSIPPVRISSFLGTLMITVSRSRGANFTTGDSGLLVDIHPGDGHLSPGSQRGISQCQAVAAAGAPTPRFCLFLLGGFSINTFR